MPDGSPPPPPYPVPPSADAERIVAALKASRPEEIPGLSWTKPDFAAPSHKIIRKFDVDPKKRPDGARVACAICSLNHPKFYEGYVLWSPDGYLRLIGHVCGADEERFGQLRFRQLVKRREQEELDNLLLDWLTVNVADIRPIEQEIHAMRAFALAWETEQKALFRDVRMLAELLENAARRHGGVLTVMQESSSARLVAAAAGGAARSLHETVAIGRLIGGTFLLRPTKHKRSRQVEGILEAFAKIPQGDADAPIMALIDEDAEQAITIAGGTVFRAMERAVALADECEDARRFFQPDNIALLERWGGDDRNPLPFSVRRYGSRIEFKQQDLSRAVLNSALPSLPAFSALRAIVTAGTEVDRLLTRHRM